MAVKHSEKEGCYAVIPELKSSSYLLRRNIEGNSSEINFGVAVDARKNKEDSYGFNVINVIN